MNTQSAKSSPSTFLSLARSVIALSSHWTQGAEARDRHGDSVSETRSNAVSFCMAGAVGKIYYDTHPSFISFKKVSEYLKRAAWDLFSYRIRYHSHDAIFADSGKWDNVGAIYVRVNDHKDTTHEDVLKVFDRAIEIAKEEEAKQ